MGALWRLAARTGWLGAANCAVLAAAFAAAILLGALVRYEIAFNAALDPDDDVALIYTRLTQPGRPPAVMRGTDGGLAAALRAARPDLLVARMAQPSEPEKIAEGQEQVFATVYEGDPELARLLTFRTISGDVAGALAQPDGAVLTTRLAHTLFGSAEVVGRAFTVAGRPYRVEAIIEPPPGNSSLAGMELLVSSRGRGTLLAGLDGPGSDVALMIGTARTYVRLTEDPAEIVRLANAYMAASIGRLTSGRATTPGVTDHVLVSLRDRNGASAAGAPPDPNRADDGLLVSAGGLALLVIAVAVLNVVNLTLARAVRRAPEIAVRKAFGASRCAIMLSELGQSVAGAVLAAVLGLGLAALLSGWFSALVGRPLDMTPDASALGALLAVAVTAGLSAGVYPALVISAVRPAVVLGARGAEAPGASLLRLVLVGIQLTASVATIAVSGTILTQLRFLTGSALAFEPAGVAVYHLPEPVSAAEARFAALLADIRQVPGVRDVGLSEALPTEGRTRMVQASLPGGERLELTSAAVSDRVVTLLQVPLLAGRDFKPGEVRPYAGGGVRPVVISAGSARALGFETPAAAVDAVIALAGAEPWSGRVVGVVADIPLGRLRADVMPLLLLTPDVRSASLLSVQMHGDDQAATLSRLDAAYRRLFPDAFPDRLLLEERVRAAYADIGRLLGLVVFFGGLSAAAAALGVLGMSMVIAAHMQREAGIRKAFGASAGHIALLLLARLAGPVAPGLAFGATIGWLVGREWLLGFPLRAQLQGEPELIAILIVAGLALLVTAWQSIRLARTRPVEVLSYE